MSETYSVRCECSNCEWAGEIEVPKGTLKPTSAVCPNCGCNTASATRKSIKVEKPYQPSWPKPWAPSPFSPYTLENPDKDAWVIPFNGPQDTPKPFAEIDNGLRACGVPHGRLH